ncbi:MAG: hypothetical protein M1823_001258 [Watsoniomyces obsoletus]|nr:MAG: hypothetical protein M1823_001258 [Watsoniomyces obsoletus]
MPYEEVYYRGKRTELLAVCISLGIVAGVVLVARLWTRFVIIRQASIDDWLIIPAGGFTVALMVVGAKAAQQFEVLGQYPAGELDEDAVEGVFWYATRHVSLVATTLTKVSVLLFYRRLINRTHAKVHLWLLWGLLGITVAYTIALGFAYGFQCTPVEAYWLKDSPQGYDKPYHCFNDAFVVIPMAVMTALTDVLVTAFPLLFVRRLSLPRQKMLVLAVVFGLGAIASVAGIVRSVYNILYNVGAPPSTGLKILIWAVVEADMGIICACVPALKPLFSRFLAGNGCGLISKYMSGPSSELSASRTRTGLRRSAVELKDLDGSKGDGNEAGSEPGEYPGWRCGADGGSDEALRPPEGAIMKKMAVNVTNTPR